MSMKGETLIVSATFSNHHTPCPSVSAVCDFSVHDKIRSVFLGNKKEDDAGVTVDYPNINKP